MPIAGDVPPNKAAVPTRSAAGVALGLWLALAPAGIAAPSPEPAAPAGELDHLRQETVALAHSVQQRESALAALDHQLDLLGREAAGRRRGLDESRSEQEQLLGVLERLARRPLDAAVLSGQPPVDRVRSRILLEAAVPALRDEARALAGEIEALAALRARIAAREEELAAARDALAASRGQLAQAVAHRTELAHRLMAENGDGEGSAAKLGQGVGDIGELIKRADAEAERRDKALLARARAALPRDQAKGLTAATADPTRPQDLRSFDAARGAMLFPVSGAIMRADPERSTTASQRLSLRTIPAATVVAPFDGRVVYAGPYHADGVILIIRHRDGYHSLLAGLGRAEVSFGQWVLAGEPVGVMPDAAGPGPDGVFYFELRRDGRPVDPQPWLAKRDETTERGDKLGD
ncbi:MAG TPA: peptidoglycan DD-metalloendopeptidase family protein [Stellaceae bacterium]|nr:peptidoglycan DD-metalloendopeptidase family protein [Stellaceae bacterium]